MSRKILITTVIIILSIIVIFLIYFYISYNISRISLSQKTIEIEKMEFKNLKNKYFLEIKDNFFRFDPMMKVASIQGDTLFFKDILSDDPKVIFSFSRFTCSSCVENEILRIKDYEAKFGFDNFILLSDYENIRDIKIFCMENNITYPIYTVHNGLPLNVYQTNLAHYFVVYNDFYLKDMYIVNPNSPDLTNDYLNIIFSKYFRNTK